MRRRIVIVALGALALAALATASRADPFWGVTGVNWQYSEVFLVDSATGNVTMVNNSTSNPIYSDIAETPNLNLYTIGMDTYQTQKAGNGSNRADFDTLYRLDPSTGAVLTQWSGIFDINVNALTAVNSTTLLAIEGGGVGPRWGDANNPALWQINLDASGNYVNKTSLGYLPIDLSDGDIARDPTTGKYWAGFWQGAGSEMWEIDISSPANSNVGKNSNVCWDSGLAFTTGGVAYASSWADKKLYTIDLVNGGSSVAWDLSGSLAGNIYGLDVHIPEPFSMAFMASALVGVVAVRLRGRRKEANRK